MLKNPFLVGPPVSGEFFFDREELVNSLVSSFGNNFALVGMRRTGKTSLVLRLCELFRKKGVVSVVISVKQVTPLTPENFLKQYSLAASKEFLQDAGAMEKLASFFEGKREGFADFLNNLKLTVSVKDVATIWFEQSSTPKDLTQLVEKTIFFPQSYAVEKKKQVLVFIDEFQDLREFGPGFLSALRENMQKTPNVSYVISGSVVGLISQIVGEKTSPFYGFFLSKKVDAIDEKSARKLLNRTSLVGIKLTDAVVDGVLEKTSCLPLYLQAFGAAAVEFGLLNKTRVIGFKEGVECWRMFFENLFFHFEYLENELSGRKKAVMQAIAQGAESVSGISASTGLSISELGSYLSRLCEEGFLRRVETGKYAFTDPLLKEWLLLKIKRV